MYKRQGPIALALPVKKDSWLTRVSGGLIYNVGRIITYMVLGAIFGMLGKGLHMAGFQLWASLVIGILMIVMVLVPLIFKKLPSLNHVFEGYSARMLGGFRTMFRSGGTFALFGICLLYTSKLDEPENGVIKMVGNPLVVEKGQLGEAQFLVIIPKAKLHSSNTKVEFKVISDLSLIHI